MRITHTHSHSHSFCLRLVGWRVSSDEPFLSHFFASASLAVYSAHNPSSMFRPASRALLRAPAFAARSPVTRRYIGTARPDEKSRSWKNKAVRLGLAIGAVYFYNTSSVFAEEPSRMYSRTTSVL